MSESTQPAMKYIAHYPETVRAQVRELIARDKLRAYIEHGYGDLDARHETQSNAALYEMVTALKRRHMSSAPPVAKVRYCEKISTLNRALGLHTYATRVQGAKLKTKHEVRVATIYKEAPFEFLEAVVVHELAHLREREHNRAFYNLCRHMLPDYGQRELDMRLWLTWRALTI